MFHIQFIQMEEKKISLNFTATEKNFLLRLISEKYAHILEDKKTDRASVHKRETAWKQIENEFNAVCPGCSFRRAEVLKNLYSNKKELRKLSSGKTDQCTVGALEENTIDQIDEILSSILNDQTVTGLNSSLSDSKLCVTNTGLSSISDDIEYIKNEDTSYRNNLNSAQSIEIPLARRRRPTTTSSLVTRNYNVLLKRGLAVVQQQTKQLKEDHSLNMKKRKLEIELLELEIAIKRKQLKNV